MIVLSLCGMVLDPHIYHHLLFLCPEAYPDQKIAETTHVELYA